MKQYLELNDLSYDVLGGFIENAAHQDRVTAPFLLGKAAAYTDMVFVLGLITRPRPKSCCCASRFTKVQFTRDYTG